MNATKIEMIRLLVVDDHPIIRQGLHQALAAEPDIEIVGEASDGAEAIRLAAILLPTVIVMDIAMPGIGGIEATQLIVAEHPGMRVLAYSVNDDPRSVARILAAGASGYVTKWSEYDELLQGIRCIATGGSFLCRKVVGALAPMGYIYTAARKAARSRVQ